MRTLLIDAQWVLTFFSVTLGVQAARLGWKASSKLPDEQEELRHWYEAKWNRIKNSPWHLFPQIAVGWRLKVRDSLSNAGGLASWLYGFTANFYPIIVGLILWIRASQFRPIVFTHGVWWISVLLLLYLSFVFSTPRWSSVFLVTLTALAGFLCFFYRLDYSHTLAIICSAGCAWLSFLFRLTRMTNKAGDVSWFQIFEIKIMVAFLIYAQTVWLRILTTTSLGWAATGSALLLPVVGISIGLLLYYLIGVWIAGRSPTKPYEKVMRQMFLFGLSIAASLSVTLAAMFVGHQFEPEAWVPQTHRLLWFNAIFDGATVVVSLHILERSISPKRAFSIPLAVVLNFVLGGLFACSSLWLGIKHLTAANVLWVLVGHSIDGQRWEIGPYFFAMHTAFLPLLIYLGILTLCWVGKATVEYREWFYGRAKLNGLTMTSRFLAYIAVVLGAVATLLRFLS